MEKIDYKKEYKDLYLPKTNPIGTSVSIGAGSAIPNVFCGIAKFSILSSILIYFYFSIFI